MKIETKLNIATALAVIVFGFSLCASAVTADWDAVKQLVGESAPGNYAAVSNKAMSAVQVESDPTVPAWAKSPTSPAPGNYAAVSNKAMSAVQPSDLETYCSIETARQMVGDAVSCSVKSNANGGVALFGSNWQYIGSMAFSHGNSTMASNKGSHAEGYGTGTAGMYAHAEGSSTHANGVYSHSEGDGTLAQGNASHAEGVDSSAYGVGSHAAG